VPQEEESDFLIAKGSARFLFKEDVSDILQKIWQRYQEFCADHASIDSGQRADSEFNAPVVKRSHASIKYFHDELSSLATYFDEMKLD